MRAILLIPMGLCLAAAPRPDLTGEWRLAVNRSDFAKQAAPKSKVVQIDHRDPVLRMTISEAGPQGDGTVTTFYSTDGVERVNEVAGNAMASKSRWDGAILEIRTSGKFGPNEILLIDRYERAAAGLTLKRHFEGRSPKGPMPAQDQVMFFDPVPLRAGVARVEITPSTLMPMYGYAKRRCGPANGYHDPLFAKVLVLESAVSKMAIVTIDLGSILSDRLRRDVSEKLKIPVL